MYWNSQCSQESQRVLSNTAPKVQKHSVVHEEQKTRIMLQYVSHTPGFTKKMAHTVWDLGEILCWVIFVKLFVHKHILSNYAQAVN